MKDRSHKTFLAALLGLLLIVACSPGSPGVTPTPAGDPVDWQRPVDEMKALTFGLEIPEHLLQENAVKTGQEFDTNAYFEFLDRLSMEPGYVLDYVYWYDDMGGRPVRYSRPVEEPPYQTFTEYDKARDEPEDAYLNHVQADSSEEAFFQLAVLHIDGGKFYLWWHAMMDNRSILTSKESLERHLQVVEADCMVETESILEQSSDLSLEPRIEFEDEQVGVELTVFDQWGGLQRKRLIFNRDYPHTLVGETTETLIPYQCGVVP